MKRKRLGDRLVEKGVLMTSQLSLALEEQKRTGEPIGQVLKTIGFVKEEDVAALLAEDMGVPFVRLSEQRVDRSLCAGLAEDFLLQNAILPLFEERGLVTVAMARPSDVAALDTVLKVLKRPLRVVVALESDIRGHVTLAPAEQGDAARPAADGDSASALANALLARALREGATDIHIEPEEKHLRTRLRVDGVLRGADTFSVPAGQGLITRVKVLSGLDVAEHRRPQDGRFRHQAAGRAVDLRVSSIPTRFGENIVLRILDRSSGAARLDQLALAEPILKSLQQVTALPHGLFLVTGPTGSGKTTTLYAMLRAVDSMTRKVASVEDPIEMELPLIRQSQVDPSIGFDFASGLRALLRQDPDVMLVGEIRDRETADIAVRASLTGHLVMTTLHTNDALGAASRLLDMGVEPFLLNSALAGVLAQRLVRCVCAACAEEAAPGEADQLLFGDKVPQKVMHGRGCEACGGTGYRGRVAIHELLPCTKSLRRAIAQGCADDALKASAAEAGFVPMVADGAAKVRRGLTTADEVVRVTRLRE
ncbi:MAG: type II/IV secretion system protein [Planctomycetes bacterium]|nr:type II/IV secretion system protein [Planctomycetota bacterium]